jgi:hypothetical protein
MSLSGGCQCGAVRFSATAVGGASICHCRMCQKAFAAPFGALVTVKDADLTWTRGAPTYFQSSNMVRRGFCAACGTPLTYVARAAETEVACCAFDDPNAVTPRSQLSYETRVGWFDSLGELPKKTFSGFAAPLISHQHPDHDTPDWPTPHG